MALSREESCNEHISVIRNVHSDRNEVLLWRYYFALEACNRYRSNALKIIEDFRRTARELFISKKSRKFKANADSIGNEFAYIDDLVGLLTKGSLNFTADFWTSGRIWEWVSYYTQLWKVFELFGPWTCLFFLWS